MAPHLLSSALFTLLIIAIHPSHASRNPDNIAKIPATDESAKVNLNLYYETLCPYCGNFIVESLVKVFNTDLSSIVNLRLVPWGNAQLPDKETIICQHGDDECYLNTIHACAIHIWPAPKKHFDFILCTENQTLEFQGDQHSKGPKVAWRSCSKKLKLDQKLIQKCYDSGLGKQLSLQYGNETASLVPKHTYVPWVTVNNTPLLDDFEKYATFVCNAYKGKKKPKACDPEHSSIAVADEVNGINSVCYSS